MADIINVTDRSPDPVEMQSAPIGDQLDAAPLPTTMSAPAPMQSQVAPNQAQFQTEKQHSTFGKIARTLFTGEVPSYNYDEKGNLIETQVPQKPGAMFRHILAGALLGGAMANQSPTKGFAGGLVTGAAGVQQDEERKDRLRREQAKEAYEMRLRGRQSEREDQKMDIEKQKLELEKRDQENKDMLAKASAAFHNVSVARLNQEISMNDQKMPGESLKWHEEGLKYYAPTVAIFNSGGMKPFVLKKESELQDFINERPDKAHLFPAVVDLKMEPGQDGKPAWQYVYGIYDLTKPVQISSDQLKMWRKVNLEENRPELKTLKPGDFMSGEDFRAVSTMGNDKFREQIVQDKASVDIEHIKAETAKARAEGAYYVHRASQERAEDRKNAELQKAMKQFKDNGYDISKMDADLQPYALDRVDKEIASLDLVFKNSAAAADKAMPGSDEAKEYNATARDAAKKMSSLTQLKNFMVPRIALPSPKSGQNKSILSPDGKAAISEMMRANPGMSLSDITTRLVGEGGWEAPSGVSTPAAAPTAESRRLGPVAGTAKKVADQLSVLPEQMLQNVRD